MEEQIAEIKLHGKEAFVKGEYITAIYFYCQVNALVHLNYMFVWNNMKGSTGIC